MLKFSLKKTKGSGNYVVKGDVGAENDLWFQSKSSTFKGRSQVLKFNDNQIT
jgi:hypothetical protein